MSRGTRCRTALIVPTPTLIGSTVRAQLHLLEPSCASWRSDIHRLLLGLMRWDIQRQPSGYDLSIYRSGYGDGRCRSPLPIVNQLVARCRHAHGRLPCERGPEAQGLVPTLPSVPEAQICSRYFMSSSFRCTTLQRLVRESNGRRSDRLLQGQPTGAATGSRYKGAPSLRDCQGPPAGWRRQEHDIRMAQSPSAA